MWKWKEIFIFLLIEVCETREKSIFGIAHYEYGTSSKSNVLSVIHMDVIPSFVPLYRVKLTSQSPLSKTITHLIVEYISQISKLSIEFDQHESVLVFHVQFPFVPIPFGVVGFSSLYDERHSSLDQWNNQYDVYKDVIQQFLVENVDN